MMVFQAMQVPNIELSKACINPCQENQFMEAKLSRQINFHLFMAILATFDCKNLV